MTIQQISVFLENRAGQLAEVTNILAGAGVNLRAIHIAETADYGVLRIIVNKPQEAVDILKSHGMVVSMTEVLGVGIDDEPGAFSKAVQVLAAKDVNIEYMYAFIGRKKDKAYVILRADKSEEAMDALKSGGFEILEPEALYEE